MQAVVRLDHELLAIEGEHDVHVMLQLNVPVSEQTSARPPVRVAIALDRSGSMRGEPLETVKRASRFLAERLGPDDEFALITYDDQVELVQSMGPVDLERLGPRIDAIAAGGMTNLSGGWLKALEEAQRRDGGIRRVILLTDGQANEGITGPAQLASVAQGSAARGVSTSTIGVGPHFDEGLLTDIADSGQGRGWHAESIEDLPGIFAEEFDDLVAVVAQNLSAEIRPSNDVTVVGVLNDYASVPVDGGVQVQLGDAYSGQQLRLVLRLHIPKLPLLGATKVAEVVLQYVTIGDQISTHSQTLPVVVNAVSAEEAADVAGDQEVADEVVVLSAAKATAEAREHVAEGRRELAADVLRSAITDLRGAEQRSTADTDLGSRAAALERTVNEIVADTFDAASRKRLHYQAKDLQRSRHRARREHDDE